MTIVERFIDFHDWPTSRKSALAGILVIPTLLFVVVFLLLAQPRAIDVTTLVKFFLVGVVIAGVVGAVSWGVYRRGREGRWTAYAFVFLYQVWLTVVTVAMGGFASPFLAFPLFLPLFSMLWYGVRLGVVSAVSIFSVLVAGSLVSLAGLLPFAPVMIVRDIDGLNTADWLVAGVVTSFIVVVAIYLVLFVEIAAADLQHVRLELAHRLIRRYVPEQVTKAVLSSTPEALERHERRKLTIFFSDLVGFTDLSDEMEPEDLATVLHDYFTEMSAIARKYAGTVDDLIGDAVLVLFGAPDFTDDHDQALRAVRMAVEMQAAMGPLNQRWEAAGIPETLTVRMGINTGVATVGNFGSADRTKYTALGKQVNVAARIQSHCEPGKVLIGHTTWLLVRDEIACIPKGELELKGLRKPMPAYEVPA